MVTIDPDTPYLLTPGPLTVSDRVRAAMMRDWGSRDPAFEALTASMRAQLTTLAGGGADHVTVPLQGSGTFAVEAMLTSFVPAGAGLLVLSNGAYGRRMVEVAERAGIAVSVYEVADDAVHDPEALRARLAAESSLTHVAMVHCETTSGLLNPIGALSAVARAAGAAVLLDAMSSFGALELDMQALGLTAVAASSNKCLQGVPGLGFVVCDRAALTGSAARPASVVLDLRAQLAGFDKDGQWRFTPPTHVVAALVEALAELSEEGGIAARGARYAQNHATLMSGMAELGFRAALPAQLQAPIIVSFDYPKAPWFDFDRFYEALKQRGFAIYAGKMRAADTFRVGVIGAITPEIIAEFITQVRETQAEMTQPGSRDIAS